MNRRFPSMDKGKVETYKVKVEEFKTDSPLLNI